MAGNDEINEAELFACTPGSSRNNVMRVDEANAIFEHIYAAYGIRDARAQRLFKNDLLKWFMLNGTSDKLSFVTDLDSGGRIYRLDQISHLLHGQVRRFARAFEDHCANFIRSNRTLQEELFRRYNARSIEELFANIDFFDTNVPREVREVADRVKATRISGSRAGIPGVPIARAPIPPQFNETQFGDGNY